MQKITDIVNSKKSTIRVYLIQKNRASVENYSCVIFPNDLNEKIKKAYQDNYAQFTKNKSITDYDNIHQEKGSIQKASLSDIDEWCNLKSIMQKADSKNIILDKKNFTDNYNVIVICFEDEVNAQIQQVYLVAQYRKVETWYKKSIKYGFTSNGLKEENREIHVLNGCIDTVIYNDEAYILQENQFYKLFNYYKKSICILESNKKNIESCSFIDNPVAFYDNIEKSKDATKKIARVMSQQSIDLSSLLPKDIRTTLSKHNEFSTLKFNEDDKIILNTQSRDMIIDILRCVYTRSLFTDTVVHTKGV